MRILLIIVSLLSSIGMMAQDFRGTGEFTSDKSKAVARNAWLELSLLPNYETLRLLILPTRDAEVSDALVDTIWLRGTAYRTEDPVVAEKYEESEVTFLYNLGADGNLLDYYVFSRFIDTTQKDVQQIVVRKFGADTKRLWCMTINSTNERSKEFFSLLKLAQKKMRFKKVTSVKGEKRREVKNVDFQVSKPTNTIGRGTPYGSGW